MEGLGPPARPGTAGADWKFVVGGLTGIRKLLGTPPGCPPGDMGLLLLGDELGLWGAGPLPGKPVGGAPFRPRWTACILASMSWETLSPLPLLEMVGGFGGRGFLAALMLPSGVDEDVIVVVAPEVDTVRGRGRSADKESSALALASAEEVEGAGGEDGAGECEGLSKTVSESTSTSGVDGLESAMANVC